MFTFEKTLADLIINSKQFTIHSDLGRVVHAIIREFERFPPLLWSNEMVTSPLQAVTLPTIVDCHMPELSGLSIEELRLLNENEEHLNDFVEEMSAVQLKSEELDGLICEVEVITGGYSPCYSDRSSLPKLTDFQ